MKALKIIGAIALVAVLLVIGAAVALYFTVCNIHPHGMC